MVCAALSASTLGVALYFNNNDLQIPLLQARADARLFPRDPFVQTLPRYASALWQCLARIWWALPERESLVALTIVQRVFTVYAACRLAAALAPAQRGVVLAAGLVAALGVDPVVGFGTVHSPGFEHTSLAVACFALALTALVETRLAACAVSAGAMCLCNVMHGAFGVLLLLAAATALPRRATPRAWAGAAAFGAVIAAPAVMLATMTLREPSLPDGVYLRLLRFYFPLHFLPSTWGAPAWMRLAGALTMTWCAARWLPRWREPLRRASLAYAALVAGAALAERSGRASVINLQLARASDVFCAVAPVAVVAGLATAVNVAPTRSRRALAAAAVTLPLAVFTPGAWSPLTLAVTAVVGTLAGFAWRPSSPRWYAHPVPLGLAAAVTLSAAQGAPTRFGDVRTEHIAIDAPSLAVARWARAQTPVSSVFLVDPRWGSFRALSQRSSFVTWKEGAAFLWQPSFARVWSARLRALGVDPMTPGHDFPQCFTALDEAYESLNDARVASIARRTRLTHWVTSSSRPSRFAEVFRAGRLRVRAVLLDAR